MKKYPHGLTLNAVCEAIDAYRDHEDDVPEAGMVAAFEILLAAMDKPETALTAQPVISDDTKRMDWLCAHYVEVRDPLMYGSRKMFCAQQDSEEWDLPHHTTLREQVDAAIASEVQE